ncbi:DUF4983 domain-containing protein [Arenibacter sp. 6A1]|uniref:alkaline phosphatase family protein n=1 Tax=Arenibacter sp. 6A1 TaxID=2720391 RepID=UPI001447F54A|nr:alkaline phosphatase family protein [Arenibacter sp. 6A1]NKI28458.1 DUF4983 domain-containing protein [Arenibacter sp. 6A1]
MKKKLTTILMVMALIGCHKSSRSETPTPDTNEKTKKVLIIGIDGCRPDVLDIANTPHLDNLISNGTYSLDARNTGITRSGPGWTSMLTGVWEDKHKVVDNTFEGYNHSNYPHLFKRIKEYDSNYKTVSVSQWHPINTKIVRSTADIISNVPDSSLEVERKAIAHLKETDLTAIFVHFDDVDHAGHSTGFSSNNPKYISAIETVDQSIGKIMSALKTRKTYEKEDWLILVSTDHGGISNNHGGNSDEERTIFIIASGDSIAKRKISKTTTKTTVLNSKDCLENSTELNFDVDGFVNIPENKAYNFGTTQDFSIECRIKSDYAGDVHIVGKKNWDNGTTPGYIFSFKTNTQKFKVNIGDGNQRADLETSKVTDNQWHTLSATFDRDGMLKVYIDGVFSNEVSISTIGNIDNDLSFTIGADGNNKYHFNGSIAEVRIFNTVLAPEEIDTWQCTTLDQTHKNIENLIGYWKMDDGRGTRIEDYSTSKNHAVLSGAKWEKVQSEIVVEQHNYKDTPRTVDVMVTALNHLCIPISPSWSLDGRSIISTECSD